MVDRMDKRKPVKLTRSEKKAMRRTEKLAVKLEKELPVRKRGEKKKAEEVNCRERIGNLHRIRERERGLPIQNRNLLLEK